MLHCKEAPHENLSSTFKVCMIMIITSFGELMLKGA